MKLSTEEDVKLKIVLDFLKSLGFQEDELSFEKSFSLRLGRSTYKIDTEEQCKKAQPRLDILVTRNNRNLFVVEVKSSLITITKEEIKQATSYAKLVHPVAPFTIVTNGQEFHIYDSLTRDEIKKNDFTVKGSYEITLPDNYKYEALKHFIGYSKDNLLTFCQNQVQESMRTLLGSKQELTKKFIPSLHTPRARLNTVLQQFIDSDKPLFVLLGESGTGKTCSMCNVALEFLKSGLPVFFYKAFDLVHGINEAIAEDLNWEFSPQYSEIDVIKRIENVFEAEKILIFIDAIDEWALPNKVAVMNRFTLKVYNRTLKVIISSKTNAWNEFLEVRGTPTDISELIYRKEKEDKGYYLEPFTPKEFHETVEKYRRFYGFQGLFEDKVLEECRKLPFLLRVFFEVAQEYQLKNLTFSCIQFFAKYYERTLKKLQNEQVADATLKAVARCAFNQNADSVDIELLRQELGLTINQVLMTDLFKYNVLEEICVGVQRKVRFYFDKLLDYIISFHVMKWQDVTTFKFSNDIKNLKMSGVHEDALKFFYPLASADKKELIDGNIRRNAEKYLDFYTEVINTHFSNFRNTFSPYTNANIGFIGEFSISTRKLGFYGFRVLSDIDDERVKFIPVDESFSKKHSNIAYLYGANKLQCTNTAAGFKSLNIEKEVLVNEIDKQLKEIIQKGKLNEKDNQSLLAEKVFAIFSKYLAPHHRISREKKIGYGDSSAYFPITFEAIEDSLLYKKAIRYYEDELIREKREKGVIKESWHGSTVSYGYSYSKEDRDWIKQKAEYCARNRIQLEGDVRDYDLKKIDQCLTEALKHLRDHGIYEIKEKLIPDKAAIKSGFIWDNYSYDTLANFIVKIYKVFLDEYRIMIETNFTTLKERFKLYSLMPITCFTIVIEDKNRSNSGPRINSYLCVNNETGENESRLCREEELTIHQHERILEYQKRTYKIVLLHGSSVRHFFGGFKSYTEFFDYPSELIALRFLVYNQIESEIDEVLGYLFKLYGVKRSGTVYL